MQTANQPADHCPHLCPTTVLLRDSDSQDTLTVLCGRLYPSRALFATVCDHKGVHDEHAVQRLCQILRASGATGIVYKSDQDNAVAAVIREPLRLSQTPGDPNHGELVRAVPEVSAVGQSASNSRAEHAVQQLEDLVRTYKSAIEARMDCKLKSDHPLMRWVVEKQLSVQFLVIERPNLATPLGCNGGTQVVIFENNHVHVFLDLFTPPVFLKAPR